MTEDEKPTQRSPGPRQPDDKGDDTTVPLGLRPAVRLRPSRLHRWFVAGAIATGVVLVFWWRSTQDHQVPSPPVERAVPQAPTPSAVPDDYRRRLQAIGNPPALSERETEQRLGTLFASFETALAAGNLLLPGTDSASEYLLQMTALAPEHPKVLEARSLLAQAFLESARAARLAGHWEEADRLLQSALDVRLAPGRPAAEAKID